MTDRTFSARPESDNLPEQFYAALINASLQVTYRQVGERLRRADVEEGRRPSALRCSLAERSRLETAAASLSPRNIDFDTCSYDEMTDSALPSDKRQM